MNPIYVTKAFMPPLDEYSQYIQDIWQRGILTNQGPLVQELETKLKNFLQVEHLHYVTNGTLALQLALSALDLKDAEIITTPFSYVASCSSVLWQNNKPVFVDIEESNFTLDVTKIEAAITQKTKAIMLVHIYGYACDVEKVQEIADRYNLKVIYDAAHAFASKYKGKSLLSYGDISICSFHATKLFHTIEGGACIVKDKEISEKIELQKRFGHNSDEHLCLGINAKQTEMNAAMGLTNLKHLEMIIADRKRVSFSYTEKLESYLQRPKIQEDLEYNYAYYPVIFSSEEKLLKVMKALNEKSIFPRRYFYPSLNLLSYVDYVSCPISEDISKRVLCLPLFVGLEEEQIKLISEIILKEIS